MALVSVMKSRLSFQDAKIQGLSIFPLHVIALLASAALGLSSCAVLASASASHSRISPCVDDRTYTLIDLGISIGSAVLIATDDEAEDTSGWVLAIPAVFLASALIGVVSTHRCRAKKEHDQPGSGYQRSGPVLYRSDSPTTAPQPVSEESKPAKPLPPIPTQRVDSLRLPNTYVPEDVDTKKEPPPPPSPGAVSCGVDLGFACPKGQVCAMSDDQKGYCVDRKAAP